MIIKIGKPPSLPNTAEMLIVLEEEEGKLEAERLEVVVLNVLFRHKSEQKTKGGRMGHIPFPAK